MQLCFHSMGSCFRNKHPAVLLQRRSRPGSKNTCTHSQDAKDPLKADYLFLRQNNSSPSCFFFMHILTCTCSFSCGQNTSRADTYSLDCLLGNLFLYEIKEERRTLERVDIGMKMAWFLYSLSGFGYEHKLVKYLSASWRRLFPLRRSLSQG